MEPNWMDEFDGAITICDTEGIIVYMNKVSISQFEKYGGEKLIGSNLIDCHPEPSKSKLIEMLKQPSVNRYTTEKKGIKKIITQSPWMENGQFKGVVEMSFEIPNPTPHHIRG